MIIGILILIVSGDFQKRILIRCKDNKLAHEDVVDSSYCIYRCPICGRLMIFEGEDTFEIYEKTAAIKSSLPFIGQVRCIGHQFNSWGLVRGKVYDVTAIKEGCLTVHVSEINQTMTLPATFYGEGKKLFEYPWEIIFDPHQELENVIHYSDKWDEEEDNYDEWFCEVEFNSYSNRYTYRCNVDIVVGDFVEVPIRDFGTSIALVTKVHNDPNLVPFPLDRLKTIFGKASYEEWSGSNLEGLLKQFSAFDIAQLYLAEVKKVHVLKTDIGHFWLEADGTPITFLVKRFESVAEHPSEGRLMLIADDSRVSLSGRIKLCTDIDFSSSRYIDILSDEWDEGSEWQVGNKAIGITVNNRLSVHEFNKLRVPYYFKKDKEGIFSFQLGWKTYKSDDDLDLFFNLT